MPDSPDVIAAREEYLSLARTLWAGTPALDALAMKDRDIFDFLGFE